jgi:hypothetical protein
MNEWKRKNSEMKKDGEIKWRMRKEMEKELIKKDW